MKCCLRLNSNHVIMKQKKKSLTYDVCENGVQVAPLYNNKGPGKEEHRQKYCITINESRKNKPSALKDFKSTYYSIL